MRTQLFFRISVLTCVLFAIVAQRASAQEASVISQSSKSAHSTLNSGGAANQPSTAGPNSPKSPVPDDVNWDDRFSLRGLDGEVKAIATSGGNLYVAGNFVTADSVAVNRVAKWNGSNWSALGEGLGCGVSYCAPYAAAIAMSGSNVYVGGMFTTAGGVSASSIAVWNGSAWSALGSGVDGYVNAIAISGNDVYVGGHFRTSGGISTHNIAKWNSLTSTWSSLDDGIYGNSVNAIAISGGDVYVGGNFNTAGGVPVTNFAKWNGSAWSDVGGGVWHSTWDMSSVNALVVSGSDVYVGGTLNMAGGLTVHNLAKWNGSIWADVGGGNGYYDYSVNALVLSVGNLYVGGNFLSAGGLPVTNFARWNGSSWFDIGGGTSSTVNAIAVNGSTVYAGGTFTQVGIAGTVDANYIAKWDLSNWSSLGNGTNNGVDGNVFAIAANGNNVYVGGTFSQVGSVNAANTAKWDANTNTWSALGSGVAYTVYSIAVSGTDIYVGGCFGSAGGNPANGIAKWNGSTWSPLGNGVTGGCVFGIAVSGSNVYAVGGFTSAGGNPAKRVAKWNGINWSALGGGIDGSYPFVQAVAISGNKIYVGGQFETAGGISAINIAQWDGSTWSAVGTSGVGTPSSWGLVHGIATSGNDLYVGGSFSSAQSPRRLGPTARNAPSGVVASNIAKWNGSTWSAIGGGLNDDVQSIAVNGTNVYVGGFFSLAGDIDVNRVAMWDGRKWSPMGSGIAGCGGFDCAQQPSVQIIAVSGNNVYVGGNFSLAGSKSSYNFGRWISDVLLYLPLIKK